MDGVVFLLLFTAFVYQGNCLKIMVCVSSDGSQAPIDIVNLNTYNDYDQPYAPWWSLFDIPCDYRSPLMDYWTELNVTKVKISVMNTHRQVYYTEEFSLDNDTLSGMILNPNTYNRSFYLTGMNGMDFLIADPADSRHIKFGMLPGPDLTRLILDITDQYYSIPTTTGFRGCMDIQNAVSEVYTITSNVSNQEQCAYECYRNNDITALVYTLDNQPEHVCECFQRTLHNTFYILTSGDRCGNVCLGDISQGCGNQTHGVAIRAYDLVHESYQNEESQTTVISVIMSGEDIELNLTDTAVANQDGKAFLSKVEAGDEQWPTLKIFHSQDVCGTPGATFRNLKVNLYNTNGTKYIDDMMAACMKLRNLSTLIAPLTVNLTFRPNHVLFPSRFILEVETENDVCEYKDVGVIDTVIHDSNIDVWYPLSGSDHLSTINHGGVVINAYEKPFPSPRVMAYRTSDAYSHVSHVFIKTTTPDIRIEVTNCGGISENRTLASISQTGTYYNFNATNLVAGETFTCLELIVVEINTNSVTSSESYIFYFYIMGCTSSDSSPGCATVAELTGVSPGFPYDRIVVHSSSTDLSPTPVKPCGDGLFFTRATFAEPMIITVILLNDDRKGSLSVNYIRVVGAVDSINLQYTPSFSNNTIVTLPSNMAVISDDVFIADFNATDMYAVRIVDSTKGSFHNITDVIIKACVLTAEILAGTYVNDSRLCESTTTAPTTTTSMTSNTTTISTTTTECPTATTSTTTTLASTSNMECCACTSVKPTISVQQAEEKAEQLAKELQVDVSTLSSTIRKKTSAKDERPSAKMVGSIGAILLSLTLGLVIILDADYIYKIYKMIQKWRRLQYKLKQAKKQSMEKSTPDVDAEKNENKTAPK